MENETMPPGAGLARRVATSGARPDKDHPPLPLDPASVALPRSSTPTIPGHRTQRTSHKTHSRSATIDPSMTVPSPPKPSTQPSVAPGQPAPPVLSAPSVPVQRTPVGERDAFIQSDAPNAFTEKLKATIAELETALQQKEADIKHYKEEIKHQKGEIIQLRTQNEYLLSEPYRQEVLSIRRHLQVDEICEPWEISKRFGEIVRKVEDISRDMGEALGSLPPIAKPTTVDLLKLLVTAVDSRILAAATPTVDLEIEDFIDFGCRGLINGALINRLLDHSVFHPGLKPEENVFYSDTYNRIRKEEPQVVAGRWRISTLKLHANRTYSPKDEALHLYKNILIPFCSTVVDLASCGELLQPMLPRFEDLFERAYAWNRLTKSSVIMLDFHPIYHPPGSLYDSQYVLLEGRKPKPPSSKATLLTSKLGLWSSNAVGGGKELEYTIQTKATMLAAEYFV